MLLGRGARLLRRGACSLTSYAAADRRFPRTHNGPNSVAGKDAVTPSALLPELAIPGATREVDICIRSKVLGHEVLIGVECRMSGSRKQTVEWVEAMHGKHSHLPTNKVVLVSSTGFTKNALKWPSSLG